MPPPSNVPSSIPGFHASWYGQSGYSFLCPGEKATSVVAYYNSGTFGWLRGAMGQAAYLGTWNPSPGQDQASPLGGDGTNGSPNTGWPRYNRIAAQLHEWVGPGQVAWFTFTVQAPTTPGEYKLYLRPLIEGATWMEDYGVFWVVNVLTSEGEALGASGCRNWPGELLTQLVNLPTPSGLCLLPYEPIPVDCSGLYGCYTSPDNRSSLFRIWVREQTSRVEEIHITAHEICHAYMDQLSINAGFPLSGWPATVEVQEFKQAYEASREKLILIGYKEDEKLNENFAELCAEWYVPLRLQGEFPEPLLSFAKKRWGK